MTCSHKLMKQMSQMFISKSPITRKSVNMVAELDNETALWTVGSVGQRLEDYSAVIATKPPSECGAEAVVDWISRSCSNARTTYRRIAEQTQETYIPSGSAESRTEPRAAH